MGLELYSWHTHGFQIQKRVLVGDIEGAKAYAKTSMQLTDEEAANMVNGFNR